MQDLNILLIEDNPADAFLIREMLNPGGSQDFRISHAGNLKESFKLIKEKRFDFIISDLGLPDSYGLDTVKSVIAKINHLPIVVLTGYNNEQMGNDALSIGAQDYLVKGTINAEQLHRSIRYAFRRKKSETELRASEVKFRTMVETSPDGVVTLNLDGAILYASKRALEEHGYLKENNLAGKKFWDLFSENDKLKVIKRFRDIEKIGVISNEEYLMIREDNSQFYGELSASLVKNEMGNANGYIVVTKDISQRKKNENAIIKYQKKLQSLVMELNLTEEKERRKIAVELHDHLGQNLAMAKIRLAALKNGNGHSENDDNYTEIEKHISHAIDYSRILTYELSPPVLFELGLVEAINWKLEQISENDDLKTNFIAETEISGLKEDYLILLFRSFSELVDNVIKHASAKYINVKIGIHNTVLIIEIEDDGKGFNPDSIYSSIYKTNKNGLFGIKERLEYYNGKLEISSQLGKGSKIKIIIPVISK